MEDDWDLHAVVRSCAAITSSSTTAAVTNITTSSQVFSTFQQNFNFSTSCFQDLYEPRKESFVQEELHDLCEPFFPTSHESSQLLYPISISSLSVLGDLPSEQQQQQQQQQIIKQLPQKTNLRQKQQSFSVSNVSKTHNSIPRSKRSKNHSKRVCHVATENLSSDMWSWRKYGQKPIKGSPYPRGYYRCSTSKGCMARRQVERNRSDPGMFIVTYTAEHNHPMPTHRNSLAGATRQKLVEFPCSEDPGKPPCSPEISVTASISSAPEILKNSREDFAEDDDDFSVSKMALDDDLLAGLDDLMASDARNCTSGHFPVNLPFAWVSNSAPTIAGSS